MINKQDLYETKTTDLRWIIYDIPGNIGWIAYFAGLILCFFRQPNVMQYWEMRMIVLLSVFLFIASAAQVCVLL